MTTSVSTAVFPGSVQNVRNLPINRRGKKTRLTSQFDPTTALNCACKGVVLVIRAGGRYFTSAAGANSRANSRFPAAILGSATRCLASPVAGRAATNRQDTNF
jgi:hypothetical protein